MDSPAVPPVRNLFATKTAVAQYAVALAGVASVFYPPALQFVQDHATAILFAIPVVNLLIRRFTHGKVQLLPDATDGL